MVYAFALRPILTIMSLAVCSHVWGFDRYYARVTKAEDAVCSGRVNRAFRNYRRAFRVVGAEMPSGTLYNYFITSVDAKKYARAAKLLAELKQRGWAFKEYHDYLAQYYAGAELDVLDRLYRESVCSSETTIDQSITRKVDSLVMSDQQFDRYIYTLPENSSERKLMHDSFGVLTRNNVMALRDILNAHYPSDRELGRKDGPYSGPPYNVLLVHAAEMNLGIYPLHDILYQATLANKLPASDFESYVSFEPKEYGYDTSITIGSLSLTVPMNPYSFAVIHDSLFRWPVSAAKIDSCDHERRKVKGLYNCKQLERRIVFQYYNPKYHFLTNLNCITRFEYTLPARIRRQLVYVPGKS